jgi:hypothetical protein
MALPEPALVESPKFTTAQERELYKYVDGVELIQTAWSQTEPYRDT